MLPMEAKGWFDANAGWIGFVGAAAGVVGLALALYFYLRPRRSKKLGWQYLSANRIIQVSETQRGQLPLKVVYDEHDVDDPNIIVLKIANAGGEEILKDDFDQPIIVQFTESKLLAFKVSGRSDPDMIVSVVAGPVDPNRVKVDPLLLNQRDWIELQFVTDGEIERPPVKARIAGRTSEPFDMAGQREKRDGNWNAVANLFGLGTIVWLVFTGVSGHAYEVNVYTVVSVALLLILATFTILLSRRDYKARRVMQRDS